MKFMNIALACMRAQLLAVALRAVRSRRRRSKSRSTTRSPSAGRSPRSSTASPPTSRRRIPGSRSSRSTPAPTRNRSPRRSPRYKSGEPPVTSVLLSTDMYTLIDEDAIVPFDDFIKTRGGPGVAQELLSGVHGEQPDRRQDLGHSVPALDDRALLQQGDVQGSGARSEPARPRTGRRWREYAQKLTKRDASGKVTQWGVQIPSSGFPYWLFQALTTENGAQLMNAAGTETYFDKPEVIEALQYWVDLVQQAQGPSAKASSSGARRRRISSRRRSR